MLQIKSLRSCSVVFGVTLKLLVINISSSFPAINKLRCSLAAISATTYRTVVKRRRRVYSPGLVAALTARNEVRYWSEIANFTYITCI